MDLANFTTIYTGLGVLVVRRRLGREPEFYGCFGLRASECRRIMQGMFDS